MTDDNKVIVVFHRFGGVMVGGYVNYNNVIDHRNNRVIYFVNERGYGDIAAYEDQAARVYKFDDLANGSEVDTAMQEVIGLYGPVQHIIAMSEFDLEMAALLRTKYDIPGTNSKQVKLFRDKVMMKRQLQSDHIRIPKFMDIGTSGDVIAFAEEIGYPLILKPKSSAASVGVKLVNTRAELEENLSTLQLDDYECEEYVSGPIFHVDGLARNGSVEFLSVSRYIGTCYGFSLGDPCGSVLISDDEELYGRMHEFTQRCIRSLGLHNGCFHMELIYKDELEPVFLEIGARVGGAEIPFFILDRFGVNLCEEAVKIEMGTFKEIRKPKCKVHGGFLQFPEPRNTPVEVVGVTTLIHEIPEIFSEVVPRVGDILDGKGAYYRISGRYMFHGESDEQIERSIRKTVNMFKLEGKPLEEVLV